MKNIDLEMTRGDTGRWNLDFSPTDALTGDAKIWFTAKRAYSDADGVSVIALSSAPSGGITINSIAGTAQVVIPPSATASLVTPAPPARLALSYDIQLKQSDGTITTVLSGYLNITSDITRAVV